MTGYCCQCRIATTKPPNERCRNQESPSPIEKRILGHLWSIVRSLLVACLSDQFSPLHVYTSSPRELFTRRFPRGLFTWPVFLVTCSHDQFSSWAVYTSFPRGLFTRPVFLVTCSQDLYSSWPVYRTNFPRDLSHDLFSSWPVLTSFSSDLFTRSSFLVTCLHDQFSSWPVYTSFLVTCFAKNFLSAGKLPRFYHLRRISPIGGGTEEDTRDIFFKIHYLAPPQFLSLFIQKTAVKKLVSTLRISRQS